MSETSEAPYIDTGAMSNAEAIAFMHAQAEIHALCPGAMPHGPSATCPVCNLSRITLDKAAAAIARVSPKVARERVDAVADGWTLDGNEPWTPHEIEEFLREMADGLTLTNLYSEAP